MSQTFKVFAVDDDPMTLDIIRAILDADCTIKTFANAEDCASHLTSEKPDLFLLDVSLPGMDGYTFCRQIKADPALRKLPVTFVSGHDTIEERIEGYNAGGEDFIVKPFEPEELLRKVKVAQSMVISQRSLAEQIEEAEHLSSLIMASMDETGILLQFMSKLIAMDSTDEIANEVLGLMQRYKLDGVVQTRIGNQIMTRSAAGSDLPLEISIIEHVRKQGRIFEFKSRSVHNFERITLMVNNLPLDDPDYCGRLRDHLSVCAQGVDSRLRALEVEKANLRSQAGILAALDSIGNSIMEIQESHQLTSSEASGLIVKLQETLAHSFYKLGLTDQQEQFIQNLVGDFMTNMAGLIERGAQTQDTLRKLNSELGQLRSN